MNEQTLAEHFKGRAPLVNIILDGWGIGKQDETDAIYQAQLPTMNYLMNTCVGTQLKAHGPHVGLPSNSDLGGSEVGHMTIGAGDVLEQGPTEIKRLIETKELFESPVLQSLIKNSLDQQTPLHMIGLLSDGNIHSHISHFEALIKYAFEQGVSQLYVHALLDGRDVPIQSALEYTSKLEALFAELQSQRPSIDYAFASGGGREIITMDRDQDWSKVEAGWNIHVRGDSKQCFPSIQDAIEHFRAEEPEIIDQAIPGFVLVRDGKAIGPIKDKHSVIFMNFRGDRAVEFSAAMTQEEFPHFDRSPRPEILYAGMKIYDHDTNMPPNYVVGPTKVEEPFGKRILELGLKQFRIAETQKYAHVTFFYNGGYREPLDTAQETYTLIESDKIPSFDAKPAMKASEIADATVAAILSGDYDYGLVNFANADMVGHSGSLEATIQAVEAVDQALKKIIQAVDKAKGLMIITADHGNADQMKAFNKKTGLWEPNTKHTLNPVPFLIYDPLYRPGDYQLRSWQEDSLNLSHIAATHFIMLGHPAPSDINHSLFK